MSVDTTARMQSFVQEAKQTKLVRALRANCPHSRSWRDTRHVFQLFYTTTVTQTFEKQPFLIEIM